jgi:hypothetical protein
MSVEIHQPEIEALIKQRIASGAFQDVEEVLLHALKSAPFPANIAPSSRTGADLVAAMQAIPYKEIEFDFSRPHMPVRDINL